MPQGYRSLLIDDLEGEGAVMAVFESHSLRVLRCLSLEQAQALEEWTRDRVLPHDPRECLAVMYQFLDSPVLPVA